MTVEMYHLSLLFQNHNFLVSWLLVKISDKMDSSLNLRQTDLFKILNYILLGSEQRNHSAQNFDHITYSYSVLST